MREQTKLKQKQRKDKKNNRHQSVLSELNPEESIADEEKSKLRKQ